MKMRMAKDYTNSTVQSVTIRSLDSRPLVLDGRLKELTRDDEHRDIVDTVIASVDEAVSSHFGSGCSANNTTLFPSP
jgi:hypothetical protein